ncbi:MAG: hypothetical protein J6T13_06655 [Bacteroidales bacterium]|nr:hypothetical protein [Bacteroidales bacterium]
MEEAQTRQYPNDVRTIRRSKRKLSIVSRWYLRLAIITFIVLAGFFLVSLFDKGVMLSLFKGPLVYLISLGFALYYSLINKGSLVESVSFDYLRLEIRVVHFTLLNRQHKVVIPFEGMSWSVLPGGFSLDRLRIFPKQGDRIVICEGGLGWTGEDVERLESALSRIVEREHWLLKT